MTLPPDEFEPEPHPGEAFWVRFTVIAVCMAMAIWIVFLIITAIGVAKFALCS
jgi:hypothetical protein